MRKLLHRTSLLTQLLLRIFAISIAAVIVIYAVISTQMDRTLEILRDQTLEEHAASLATYLEPGKSVNKIVFDLPAQLRLFYAKAGPAHQYVVRDSDGTTLFRSPQGYASSFPPAVEGDGNFTFTGPNGNEFVGFTTKKNVEGRDYYLQVAQAREGADILSDRVSDTFMTRLLWVGIPFYAGLVAIILLTVRRGFSPLGQAAREVSKMNIATPDFQIAEQGIPEEILPFIKAINFSFRRLAKSIQEQKELTENLAHELRTPLAVLKAHIEMLGRDEKSSRISRDVDAMIKLLNQMLDATRLEYADTIQLKEMDLAEVVSQVCQDLWPLFIRDRRELRVTGVEAPVPVLGDRDLIYRALRNILDNALEHSPAKTPVEVSLEGGSVRVRDFGTPIPGDRRTKIFERFDRGDRATARSSGAGLGLSIVRRTMEVHGGSAWLEPAPNGEGNIFCLEFKELPAAAEKTAAVRVL
jgi:signal transduction histidine kinase